MSIFRLFGDDRYVPLGVYDEFYRDGLITTNIYTIFRGLISDFTLPGSLFVLAIIGSFFSMVYINLLCRRKALVEIIIYPYIIGIIYQTYIISTLIWNQIYIVILFSIVIYALKLKKFKL
jgi:hypothetical protein